MERRPELTIIAGPNGAGKITMPRRRKLYSAYELSLRDLDEGRVYKYDSLDDLIKEINRI